MAKHKNGDPVTVKKVKAVVFPDGHTAEECPVNELDNLSPDFAKCDHEITEGPGAKN